MLNDTLFQNGRISRWTGTKVNITDSNATFHSKIGGFKDICTYKCDIADWASQQAKTSLALSGHLNPILNLRMDCLFYKRKDFKWIRVSFSCIFEQRYHIPYIAFPSLQVNCYLEMTETWA